MLCDICNTEMLLEQKSFNLDSIDIKVNVFKCKTCGNEVLANDIPKSIEMLIRKNKQKTIKNKLNEIFNLNNLRNNILSARQNFNFTQRDITAITNIAAASLCNVENNCKNITLITAFKLAHIFNCKVSELFYFTNDEVNNQKKPCSHLNTVEENWEISIDNVKASIPVLKCKDCGYINLLSNNKNKIIKLILIENLKLELEHFLSSNNLICDLYNIINKSNLNINEISNITGMTIKRLNYIKKSPDNISLITAFKLAYSLNCKLEDLFFFTSRE